MEQSNQEKAAELNIPKSFIKNVAIQLRSNYKLSNNPYEIADHKDKKQKNTQYFIGRKNHISKFKAFLNDSKKGVFLVTGYRGMGKTSFVNYVLDQYICDKKEQTKSFFRHIADKYLLLKKSERISYRKIIPIHLTLAQSHPKEFDVLRQVVNSIAYKYPKQKNRWIKNLKVIRKYLFLLVIGIILLKMAILNDFIANRCFFYLPELTSNDFFYAVLTLAGLTLLIELLTQNNEAYNRIKKLLDRCHASVSEEKANEHGFGAAALSSKFNHKRSKAYPIADSKEIEYELLQFLKLAKKQKLEFIFIFDELDKIELQYVGTNLNEDLESFENRSRERNGHDTLRQRKQAVLGIIAGLKNFFTTADARFIFIAGREMFDASLADISDKQSPLSSIFTYTFNIETLLKEEEGYIGEKNISSLSTAIEEFLKFQLLSDEEYECENKERREEIGRLSFLELVKSHYCQERPEEFMQAYFMLQGFITFLVYRTSGSPKKLIKTFQEFVVKDPAFKKNKGIGKVTVLPNRPGCAESENYLYFNYLNQYRIGFINSIYRPFLIQHGRSYKVFSENTMISVPYLFDHLFKFHPFAFATSNLELIPEILSHNKAPYLKHDLKQVITYLCQSHLRITDIELFDYKFSSKTANEITFISRVFEDEAAAFNFTLDESYPIKAHLTEKIKELRSIHSKFAIDTGRQNPQIFSIASLNSSLGDLYFFDQEFENALNCYSDAIRLINNLNVDEINLRDFIGLVRNKLKIGLCFEKIYSYEEALSFYSDSVQDIKRYFSYLLNKATYVKFNTLRNAKNDHLIPDKNDSFATGKIGPFYSSSLNDLLQVCVQSFMANLYIQEKMGLEGVTTPKVKAETSDFFKIADEVARHCGRNHLIIANSLLHHGKLLYYKNSPVGTGEEQLSYESTFPDWYTKKRSIIDVFFPKEESEIDGREPILAFKVYMLGLDEVMHARRYFENTKQPADNNTFLFPKAKNKVEFLEGYLQRLLHFVSESENNANSQAQIFTANHYKYIAGFLSSIGDCILGMKDLDTSGSKSESEYPHQLDLSKIVDATEISKEKNSFYKILTKNPSKKFRLTDALKCYLLSAKFYELHGNAAGAAYEYRKILQVMILVLRKDDSINAAGVKKFIEILKTDIVDKVNQLSSVASGRTDSHMKLKVRDNFNGLNDPTINHWPLSYSIANSAETKDIDLMFENIKGKLGHSDYEKNMINSHFSISTQHMRITELDYYCRVLYKKIIKHAKEVGIAPVLNHPEDPNNPNDPDPKNPRSLKLLKQYLLEYLYSKNSIIRILKIYETDYLYGPGFLAYMHYSIATLLGEAIKSTHLTLHDIIVEESDRFRFREKIRDVLGDRSTILFDRKYHLGMAKDNYKRAIELHTAGSEYRRQIKELIYLEDDFNDNAYHFGAALGRHLMINCFFFQKIDKIDKELQKIADEPIKNRP